MELSFFGMKCRLEIIVLCVVVAIIIGCHLLGSCSKIGIKEGMQLAGSAVNVVVGDENYNSWITKANDYAASMGYTTTQSKYASRKGTPVPLPEGQLDMFAENNFSPECCPSTYSNSVGCNCITLEQVDYLGERGGNS